MAKYNSEDVEEIARQIRTERNKNSFVLLTGAGCSVTAGIPTAPKIIEEIHANDELNPYLSKLNKESAKDYGRVMECLDLQEREDILKNYLDAAKVNWAHIAIATMMDSKNICRVLTFNFDNILARACGKSGLYPQIYDFVSGVSESGSHIKDPAIVHLHGQGFGIAMLNAKSDTEEHADKLRPLLIETMDRHPLLIIGYSGLSDQVFPIIREIYKGRRRIHWVDFKEEANDNIAALRDQYPNQVKYYGGADADQFLVDLAYQLECFPPLLFKETTNHLRREIDDILPYSFSENSELDVKQNLENQLARFDRLDREDADAGGKNHRDAQAMTWLMADKFPKVIDVFDKDSESISPNLVGSAWYEWGNSILEKAKSTQDIALFDSAIEKYEKANDFKPDNYATWLSWGVALALKSRIISDTKLLDDAIEKFSKCAEIAPEASNPLNNWGTALVEKGKLTNNSEFFKEAKIILLKAKSFSDKALYNLACLAALQKDFQDAQYFLEESFKSGVLPNASHLESDNDLDSLRDLDWFKDFIKRVKKDS